MDFKGLSNAVTNTHPLLPSMGTTRQKSSCRNRLQNGPHSLLRMKVGTHSPLPTGSHTAAHRAKRGAFRMGGGISTLGAFHTFRKPCVARYQNGKLCRFWALVGSAPEKRREPAGQRCAYARRCPAGVAAPLGCVIPLLFLSPHRWASRFCSAASLAHRKLSVCSLVTAVRFLNRCSRRSMRETYPLGQRSGCRF